LTYFNHIQINNNKIQQPNNTGMDGFKTSLANSEGIMGGAGPRDLYYFFVFVNSYIINHKDLKFIKNPSKKPKKSKLKNNLFLISIPSDV